MNERNGHRQHLLATQAGDIGRFGSDPVGLSRLRGVGKTVLLAGRALEQNSIVVEVEAEHTQPDHFATALGWSSPTGTTRRSDRTDPQTLPLARPRRIRARHLGMSRLIQPSAPVPRTRTHPTRRVRSLDYLQTEIRRLLVSDHGRAPAPAANH